MEEKQVRELWLGAGAAAPVDTVQCPCGQLPLPNGPSPEWLPGAGGGKSPLSGTEGTRHIDVTPFSLVAFSSTWGTGGLRQASPGTWTVGAHPRGMLN